MNALQLRLVRSASVGLSLSAIFALGGGYASAQQQRSQMSFSEDVTPIFRGNCVSCHQPGGEGYQASGLDLTSYDGLMKGTKFGPMVVPGKPDLSNLMVLIKGQGQIRMPKGHKPLPNELVNNIWNWIFEGAKNN
jgi:hypothetical protein